MSATTYRIEVMAPGATTRNYSVAATTREVAVAAARNLGHEPIFVAPYGDGLPALPRKA